MVKPAAHQRLDSRMQLVERKRFYQIIICAQLKPGNFIPGLVAGRKYQDFGPEF